MAYLLLFLGFLLVSFFGPETLKYLTRQEKDTTSWRQLEARLLDLTGSLNEALARLEKPASLPLPSGSSLPSPVPEMSFAEHLVQARADPYAEIQRAYAAGEDVASLASRYGKGKGEIELILNLHRS